MEYYSAGGGFPEMEGEPSSGQWQHEQEWHPHHTETALEEAMWADSPHPPYPERPNEPDCPYYMRTGLCRFGANCRFNHPPNRRQASMAARTRDEFPERAGQPECQYYLKTGTCKFGATCKYHHPRDKAGLMGRTQLNILNLPLRPGEKDCAYYMRTGQCKFGSTCKFNHPNPEVSPVAAYQGVGSSSTPQAYPSGVPWQIPRPFLSVPRLQVPPSYAPVLLSPPQGVISIPGWNLYQGAMGAEGQQASYVMGPTASDPMAMATFPGYISGTSESGFPERPGHPECQYYMKTGDCKYGMSCKFHHPRDRSVPSPTCILSPMGLPLRPGAPPCTYYLKSGYCKFGSVCKFDHPLITVPYSPLASPMSDIQQGSTYTTGGVSPVFVPTSTGLRRQPSSSSYPPHMTPSLTVPISSASFPPSSSS